jgi:MSHA biogenesis protein MshL
MFKRSLIAAALSAILALSGCASITTAAPRSAPVNAPLKGIHDALAPQENLQGTAKSTPVTSSVPGNASTLAPTPEEPVPLAPALAQAVAPTTVKEQRFSVNFVNVTPDVAFMSILHETQLSVVIDPSLKAPMSVLLKDVTVKEALEVLRELYGFDYQLVGRQLVVKPSELQTRMFRVSYPVFNRNGRSEVRIVSGSIAQGGNGGSGSGSNNGSNTPTNGGTGNTGTSTGGSGAPMEASRITTSQHNDVWTEIEASIKLLMGEKEGRNVVVSPQTGTLIVRGMPRELRAVADYLDSARISIERQVMLEAKIVEVQLRETVSTGINWAAFNPGSSRGSLGVLNPGANLRSSGTVNGAAITSQPGTDIQASSSLAGGLLGLAFQSTNFAAVLEFLGTQGQVQVLSSPRIATMNNQKAVLKVGTDDFFVTNISTTTNSSGNTSTTSPTISVQPFFSGIALDVTPHIDDQGFIVLHVHPAVSNVSERNKVLDLGTLGKFTLPLASSDVNESDSVIRAHDGRIVAIGGLMRQEVRGSESGVPGVSNNTLRHLLGGRTDSVVDKRELVILLKPTVIDINDPEASLRADPLARIEEWLKPH